LLLIFELYCLFFQQVTKEELAKLVQGFDKTDLLTSGGLTLAGQRHIYLSGTDRVVRAKLGKTGVHCMKTQQGEKKETTILFS
jgi:profilin